MLARPTQMMPAAMRRLAGHEMRYRCTMTMHDVFAQQLVQAP